MSESAAPFRAANGGVKVALRVVPRAGRNRIEGVETAADGRLWLKVAVTAPPDGGKANKAVIALLAKAWRVPQSSITVVAGATARRKTILVAGAARDLMPRLRGGA